MGTEISLDVGGMTVDWCKNSRGNDHGALFQESDRKRFFSDQIDYDYSQENDPDFASMGMGFARSLRYVLPRLELLGFTLDRAKQEYLKAVESCRKERAFLNEEVSIKP